MKEVTTLSPKKKALKATGDSNKWYINPLIAMLITAVCYVLMCVSGRVYPFGTETILLSDLEAQYAPFLFLYKHLLTNMTSVRDLFYSFSLGAGKNMMATFGYYLASPINFLVLLFKPENVSEFIVLIIGIKLVLASFFMTLFIQERQEIKTSKISILFGILYASTSYAIMFMFQIMWLDGYALLPLLLFFVERYIKTNKKAGIIVTLLFLFLSNYYIAYMVGVFSFFYLLVRMGFEGEFKDSKKAAIKISKFILMAVLCAMTLAVILFPVGLDTLGNVSPDAAADTQDYVGFSAIDLLDQMFAGLSGEFSDVMIANLPFVFISTFITLAVVVSFISKVFSRKEKILYASCLGIFYLSLSINVIDTFWQAFDSPNWFYHRHVFVFFPVLMVIGLRVYERLSKITYIEILKSSGILLGMLFIAQSFGEISKRDRVFVFNMILIVAVAGLLMLIKMPKGPESLPNLPQISRLLLVVLLVFETVFMNPVLCEGISTFSLHYGGAKEYKEAIIMGEDILNEASNYNNGFRVDHEAITSELYPDGSSVMSYYAGTNGMSLFNSNSNKGFHRFLKQLGYYVNYNYFVGSYSFAAEDTDAFFSMGAFWTEGNYSNATVIPMADTGNSSLYVNEEVLPLVFTASSSCVDFDFYRLETDRDDKNYFDLRNDWYASMFESFNEDFYYAPENEIEVSYVNANDVDMNDYVLPTAEQMSSMASVSALGGEQATSSTNEACDTLYRVNKKLPIIINYDITIESSDELYMNVSIPKTTQVFKVYVNGMFMEEFTEGTFYSPVIRIGSYDVGDTVRVTICSDRDSFSWQSTNFGYLNHDIFAEQFEGITNNTSNVVVRNGYVTFESNLNDNEIVLTSIPYEDGWTLTIDGNEAEIIPYQDALIAIDPGTGAHSIELTFTPPGMKLGGIVSCVGIVGLVIFGIMDKKRKGSLKGVSNK